MIKLSELKKDILVDETTVYKLTGINSQPVYTIGSVVLRIQLGTKDTTAVFQVTHDNFPIAEAGILGAPFLRDNEININFRTSTLSIDSPNHPEPRETIPTITLQPRSETLVPVLTDVEDRTTLIIHSQNIGKKGILMGNVVNHVRGGQVLVSVINPSGDLIEFFPPQLRDVQHDILKESVYPCNHIGEQQEEDSRIARLTRVIQTEHLNSEERASLLRICKKYQDIFHFEGEPLSFTTAIQHDIKTPEGTAPVNIRPYRLPYAHRQVIVEQMEKLEQENIIQPSESPWNAPLVVVPKKPDANGKPQFRVCVDFRRLNQLTIGDAFPIPRIDEILDQLGRSRYYTTLDLASGYHQVPIRPQDCEKTGFSTDKGHFEFVRMPFGLCGAPSTFQRLMNNVLTGLNGTKAFVYLDDIIIYAVDLVQHEARLEEVFQRLREFNLHLQPSKCQFLRHEVVYLGHLITDAGVKPDPTKISCVRDHPVPRNPIEIKRFLGLSGYYRRFIEKYSQIAKPMTTLLKKGQPFEWTAECQTAFETLVQKLVTAPILQYPNFEEPFILTTDASQYAIGSIISQGEIGQDLPIAYASRTLNKAEQNYSTTEKELLSIVWSVKHFRPYLLGRKFRIYTDHQPLTWLFNVKDPGSRLMRWRLKLAEYQYEVIYKPGVTNTNADALSRMGRVMLNSTSITYIQMNFDTYLELVKDKTVVNNKVIEETGDLFDAPLEYSLAHCVSQDLKMNQGMALMFRRKFGNVEMLKCQHPQVHEVVYIRQEDRYILYMVTKTKYWQKSSLEDLFLTIQNLRAICIELNIKKLAIPRIGSGSDQLDWPTVRIMVRFIFKETDIEIRVYPQTELKDSEKKQVLAEHHSSPLGGHRGINQTLKRIQMQFNWDGLAEDVKEYVAKCPSCQIHKTFNKNVKQPMVISTTAMEPFEKVFIDVVGPLPKTDSDNVYILTMQCDLTKFSMAVPMINHEANTVAYHFVTSCVCLHGIPKVLVSDQGTEFLSRVLAETCKLLKIKKCNTSPYHPQANGALERSHRTLGEYLRHFVDKYQMNWDTFIPYAMFVFNSSEHRSTGKQPYELMYGRTMNIPNSVMKPPEPRYNYEDYHLELKQKLQVSHQIARDRLLEQKQKTKEHYDQKLNQITVHVGDRVLLKNNARKGKLSPKWLGPYEFSFKLLTLRKMINLTTVRNQDVVNKPYWELELMGPIEYKAERPLESSTHVYNITSFQDHQGLYFEHHGPVKMSHFNWNLVAYVNLADPGYKYQSIRSQYEATAEICELMTERFGSTEISNACEQFVQLFARATLPYLYEIETSHRNMLLSIGDKDTGKVRARRGLAHTVQQVANVLYGMYSSIDTEFIFNKIIALSQNKSQNITLNLERMRIMQVETDNQVKEISQHEEKLEENLRYLQKQTEIIIQELDRIEFKTRLLEQALLFEILLNQYSYEIRNLMSIINSAMNGKIHTSVFTSDRLLVELREIKMNLAVGTALPLEIKAESLTGFLQVSDLTIFHREHYLVFSIEIPLTSVEEYTMYHPIPLPIIYNENTIALISPEVDYLALSNDDENFISLGVSQWEECTKLGAYTLCKGDQPIHYRAGSNLCELSHLISLESPLKDCGVKLVTLEAPIWHRLSKVNSWLYYTQRELCTIMCPDPPQTFRVEISGVGRLTVSPSCEIHTENSILVPFYKTNRDIKLDLIPENQKFNIKSMLTETLSSVLPQTLSNVKIFNNLNSLAHKALELSKLEPKSIEPLFIFKIEFHITILYISLTFFVLVISA
ncbi:hypothetical protein QTP88_028314 [Uroleucon formosanum]